MAVSEGGDEVVLVMMMTTGGQAQRHAVVIVLHAKCATISVLLLIRQNNYVKNCCTITVRMYAYIIGCVSTECVQFCKIR